MPLWDCFGLLKARDKITGFTWRLHLLQICAEGTHEKRKYLHSGMLMSFHLFFSPLFPLVRSCNFCLFVFHLLKDGEYISASLALQAHIHSNEKTGNVFEVTGLLCTFISTPWRGIYLIFSLASISTTSLPSLQPSNFTNTSSPYMFAFTRLLVLFSPTKKLAITNHLIAL